MRATLTTRPGHETTALKFAGLMAVMPLLGLAYVVIAPFAGLALVAGLVGKTIMRHAAKLRDIALFFAAPFIGLAYIVFLPVVGLALAWVAARALAAHRAALRTVAMMVVGPLRGLAYILLLPVVGLVTLATLELRHLAAPRRAAA